MCQKLKLVVTPIRPSFTQENIDRLENGLAKLQKVQGDVDVLVADAKEMAVQVELKVASANVFAEQVRRQNLLVRHLSSARVAIRSSTYLLGVCTYTAF